MKIESDMKLNNLTNKIKFALASGLVMSGVASFVSANEGNVQHQLDPVVSNVIDHQLKLDDLRRQAEIRQAEAQIIVAETGIETAKLNKKKAELEIREMENAGSDESDSSSKEKKTSTPPKKARTDGGGLISSGMMSMLDKFGSGGMASPTPPSQPGSNIASVTDSTTSKSNLKAIERVYVVRVFGADSKEATIIMDGSTFIVKEGDSLNGVKVDKIEDNKVLLSHKGEKRAAFIVSRNSVK